jgi:hypothetical protein
MKPKVMLLLVAILYLGLTGCAYMNVKAPFDTDVNRSELGAKTGTAEAYSLLWLFAWGDASYATAAANGGITTLRHADQEMFQVLFGLYTRWRIIVYGD